MPRINIEIPDEVHRKLKAVCALKDIVLKDYVQDALKDALKNDKDKY